MIIGTAGHIDHGKTTLVRALTGVDTDRLVEEKARGISIELGYAYTPLPNGDVLGFIDVPGHERLVHTMVAGACGIDFALLVIAADDGVMPQTREHLAILELLGVSRGAVALTKTDRVEDPSRLKQVQAEIAGFLGPTPLRDAPVIALNATVDADSGTESLRQHLFASATQLPLRQDQRLFRLPVDRAFTLSGHGTIATGTVFSGQIRSGDSVVIMPAGIETRIRSIHAQDRPVEVGRAGQRCALNLAGVAKSALTRGDWLADPRALAPATRVDVGLKWLENPQRRSLESVHIHLGTAHRVARVLPLNRDASRAQLSFDAPLCASPGDRLILRDAQAAHTLGGGIVLDTSPPTRKRSSPQRQAWLDAVERLLDGEGLAPLLRQAPLGLKTSELVHITCSAPELIDVPPDTVAIDAAGEHVLIQGSHWSALRERTLSALQTAHTDEPDEPGPTVEHLRRMVATELSELLWRALIERMTSEGLLSRSGPWVHLPGHTALLSADDQKLAHRLQPLIASGGFDPPWVRDLAVYSHVPEERVRDILRKSVRQGVLYQVVRDLFYDRECIRELAAIVRRIAHEHGSVDAARYRDALGLGRKRSIQILEFFDRVGYTRRVRDTHLLRPNTGWQL